MSRIISAPVKDGEVIAAADLNARFTDYTQTDLNAFNVRDAAVDLAAFSDTDFMVPFIQADNIGKADLFAAAPVTVNGIGALPSAGYVVNDGGGPPVDTIATFAGGLAVTTDDVLRVYWHLNVNPIYTGTPWTAAGALDTYEIASHGGGPHTKVSTNGAVWVMYLQWDITSAALTNWTEPDYQNPFTTPAGASGYIGNILANCTATSVTPCWLTSHDAEDREMIGSEVVEVVNWRAMSGAYYYTPAAGTTTIYGMRLVIKGPMHPYNTGGVNYLVHTLAPVSGTNVQLEYTSGTISTIKQRLS
jgi:hypothetical protein